MVNKRIKEYVKVVRTHDNGKTSTHLIKKSLAENKIYMANNRLREFIEPHSEEIKDQLEKDRKVLSSQKDKGNGKKAAEKEPVLEEEEKHISQGNNGTNEGTK